MDREDLVAGHADSGLHLEPGHVEIHVIVKLVSHLSNISSDA